MAQNSPVPTSNNQDGDGRESWGNEIEYILAAMGYAVGVGNVWRFPYLAYRFGGGTFLVPYFLSLVFLGIPLFMLESIMGQTNRSGIYKAMKRINPRLRGIGIASAFLLFFVSIYYNILIAWSLYFTGRSFENPLPWTKDDLNVTLVGAEVFWFEEVLQRSPEPFLPTKIVPPLLLTLFLGWSIIFVSLSKGVKSTGKVVYFTVSMPFILLFILLMRALTLPGASVGIEYYLTPDPEQLLSVEVWIRAAQQIFYSLGVGWGTLMALASYNKSNYNTVRNSLIITLTNSFTSIIAGLVVFGVIGYLSNETGLPVETVVQQGTGLTFVVIPEALALFPVAQLFAFLFFLMLLLLGIDSQFADVEALVTFIRDLGTKAPIWKILAVVCLLCCCGGLLLVSDAGIDWFTLMDDYVAIFVLFMISFVQSSAVTFKYGVNRLADDYHSQSGHTVPRIVVLAWKYLCPALTGLLLISAIVSEITKDSDAPRFARAIGLFLATVPFVPVILCALVPDFEQLKYVLWLEEKVKDTSEKYFVKTKPIAKGEMNIDL